MGTTYTIEKKQEEVVIAQNGANQASTSHTEYNLEVLGIMVSVMAAIMCIAFVLTVCKVCANKTKSLLRQELSAFQNNSVAGVIPQPVQRSNNYDV